VIRNLSSRFLNSHRSNLIHHQPLVVSTTTTTHTPAVAAIALPAPRFWCFHYFAIPYPEQRQSSTPTTSTAATTSHTSVSHRPYQGHYRRHRLLSHRIVPTSITYQRHYRRRRLLSHRIVPTSITYERHYRRRRLLSHRIVPTSITYERHYPCLTSKNLCVGATSAPRCYRKPTFPNPKGIVTSVVLDKPRVSMRQLGSVSGMSEVLLEGSVSTMLTILHTG
jgi:hypothetical protein